MTTPSRDPSSELTDSVQASWQRFTVHYEPLRHDLYRYCRYLTRSPWDAEDLAQDTLGRAFVTLGAMASPPPNPRAWLFRVASNLWIDQRRRRREEPSIAIEQDASTEPAASHDPRAPREAAGSLMVKLSPQERAAVVLKDVFDLSLDEIAETLSTSAGAVKAALHRGRGKLVEPDAGEAKVPVPGALDAFCDAFNARDIDRLTSLLLETATVEVVGVHVEHSAKNAGTTVIPGMLFGSRRMSGVDPRGGMDARYREGVHPTPPRFELRFHRGEWLLLSWYAHDSGEAVRAITRVETEGDKISRVRNYFFTPDFIADVCRELDVPFHVNGHRHC